jgi:hypothetical protein
MNRRDTEATEKIGSRTSRSEIDFPAGREVKPFQDGDVGGHADREGGHEDVPADQPGELEARQKNRIKIHDDLAGTTSGHRTTFGGGSGGTAIGAPVYRSHTTSNAQGPSPPVEGPTEAGGRAALPDEQQ